MRYIELLCLWCFTSLIGLFAMVIRSSYDPIYLIHFFIGVFIIIAFGLVEAIVKDIEKNIEQNEIYKKDY